jgi:trk system potassium uptake protein TrkH
MNYTAITNVLGKLLIITGTAMLVPIFVSLVYGGDDLNALITTAALSIAAGIPLWRTFRRHHDLNIRDGFFIAFFGWILISGVSALPFMLHGAISSFTDAFFEMMSGYTTSGATILEDIEALPRGLVFWRSQTHLLGGMGFLTLTIIFLPHGMGGVRIFRAESSPGQVITREKFLPRNRDTMVWLWGIYIGLNLAQTLLMCAGGMSLYDSLCHAFGTVSTSGYSPYNASVGHYNNAYFDWIIILFMFLGGLTFMLFYHMRMGNWKIIRINTELRWYLGFMVFFCGTVALILWQADTYTFLNSLRYACFQVTSLLTTTGFTTADYELWPQSAQMFLYAVCFIGACAGSTTSGIKVVHYVLIWKFGVATIKQIFFSPMSLISVRMNGRRVDPQVGQLAVFYFIVNIFLVLAGGCVMVLLDDMDYGTAMSSVIATVMNIGPGFGDVGPSQTYAFISDGGKWFLSWLMLVGRLEMFSALVIFYPSFWRR